MKKLTQGIVDAALPQPKEYYLWDHKITGLGCRVYPSGIKTYYFRYTSPIENKRKKIKIVDANLMTLEEARINARDNYLIKVEQGIDPLIEIIQKIEEQKASITFEEFWPRFYDEYIQIHHKKSTIKNRKSYCKIILDYFGKMELNKIEYDDIMIFKKTIKFESVFSILLTYLRPLFNHAELCKLRPLNSNPCTHIKGKPSNKREKYITNEEKSKFIEYIEDKIKKNENIYSYYGMLCILFAGQRKNEILKLKWEDVDFEQKIATLHDSKTGKRIFFLNDTLITIFKQIPKIDGNPYIFCGKKPNSCLTDMKKAWQTLRSKINIKEVRIHDLRHSFASFAINNGVNMYELSKLLGHSNISTTQRYAHLYTDTLIKASNKVFE